MITVQYGYDISGITGYVAYTINHTGYGESIEEAICEMYLNAGLEFSEAYDLAVTAKEDKDYRVKEPY